MTFDTSYVSSQHDWDTDQIMVWQRPVSGGPRSLKMYPAPRYFYAPSPTGQYTTITGETVEKIVCDTKDEFEAEKKMHRRRFESDFQPEARLLMDEYHGRPTPVINYAFLDIEVDYSSKIGWSSPENPYAPINAITIYQSWTKEYLTYAVPPKGWKDDGTFQEQIKAHWAEYKLGFTPNVTVCKDERELLLYMLGDIEDADIISGWNSEFFDNPYIIKRLERVLGKRGPQGMCFKGARAPNERVINRFGSPAITYTLYGRTHLDYLDLFKKFTFEGRVSYSLANISAEELDTPKLDYPGTLEQLYNNNFVMFVTYNARDVEVLTQLDKKYNFMQLVNQMAHENTVPFMAILGTVRYVETGITNRTHNVHKLIVTDKVIPDTENDKVEGAIVMTPRAGLHQWLGSVDLQSLYPRTIMALNMSIETFVGQFEDGENAWLGVWNQDSRDWMLQLATGETMTLTGAEWHAVIRESNYAISAFGTVFDQTKPGMVADTLLYWFTDRIRLQGEKKKFMKLVDAETDPIKKAEYEHQVEHYDLLQLTKKIQLNSAYGALLNEAFRFGRREIGASVTGTGRQITKHMGQTIAEACTGAPWEFEKRFADFKNKDTRAGTFEDGAMYARWLKMNDFERLRNLPTEMQWTKKWSKELNKEVDIASGAIWFTECPNIIYGDTDSCYFLTDTNNYDDAVMRADAIAEYTNKTFPDFLAEAFNCVGERRTYMKAQREIVAERGIFLFAKKKYTLKVVNLDGKDLRDKPKLKSMGSEIKKADTPKAVQQFLIDLMDLLLGGEPYSVLEKFVNEHRGTMINADTDVLSLAPAKQVNNLDTYYAEFKRTEKIGNGRSKLPGHVRAAVNYNELIELYDPEGALKPLRAGDKAAILYLKPNHMQIKSIGFPPDMLHLPEWFKENFQVDLALTESKMIDSKIEGIFEALGQELPTPQNTFLNSTFSF